MKTALVNLKTIVRIVGWAKSSDVTFEGGHGARTISPTGTVRWMSAFAHPTDQNDWNAC